MQVFVLLFLDSLAIGATLREDTGNERGIAWEFGHGCIIAMWVNDAGDGYDITAIGATAMGTRSTPHNQYAVYRWTMLVLCKLPSIRWRWSCRTVGRTSQVPIVVIIGRLVGRSTSPLQTGLALL